MLPVLFPLPFPSLSRTAKGFAAAVLGFVHGNTSARTSIGRTELADCALRAFTSMLRNCKFVKVCGVPMCLPVCLVRSFLRSRACLVQVTQDELCALLILLQGDLANSAREGSTFALLRAVIHRKLIAPEVYDIMVRPHAF